MYTDTLIIFYLGLIRISINFKLHVLDYFYLIVINKEIYI